ARSHTLRERRRTQFCLRWLTAAQPTTDNLLRQHASRTCPNLLLQKQGASGLDRRRSVRSRQICKAQFLRRCPALSEKRVASRAPKCGGEPPGDRERPCRRKWSSPNRVRDSGCAVVFLPCRILLAERIDSNASLWTKPLKRLHCGSCGAPGKTGVNQIRQLDGLRARSPGMRNC